MALDASDASFKPGYRITWPVLGAQGFLALLCVGTGLFAPAFSAFARTLIAGVPASPLPETLYDLAAWKNTAAVILGGLTLFLLANTHPGKRIAEAIRNRPRGFHGLFVSFALGLAVLSFWLRGQL